MDLRPFHFREAVLRLIHAMLPPTTKAKAKAEADGVQHPSCSYFVVPSRFPRAVPHVVHVARRVSSHPHHPSVTAFHTCGYGCTLCLLCCCAGTDQCALYAKAFVGLYRCLDIQTPCKSNCLQEVLAGKARSLCMAERGPGAGTVVFCTQGHGSFHSNLHSACCITDACLPVQAVLTVWGCRLAARVGLACCLLACCGCGSRC